MYMSIEQFTQLRKGQTTMDDIQVVYLGDIKLWTGKMVVGDLMALDGYIPLEKEVMPGTYPVYAYMHHINGSEFVSFIEMRFEEKIPKRYKNAIGPSHKKEEPGFPIYNKKACIIDALVAKEIEKYTEQQMVMQRKSFNRLMKDKKAVVGNIPQIVACESGIGNEVYGAYFGVDALGKICNLVLDFRTITSIENLCLYMNWGTTYDLSKTHSKKIKNKNLAVNEINATNHLAVFLKWMVDHDLISTELKSLVFDEVQFEDYRKLIEINPAFFGALRSGHFNEKGRRFASEFYVFNGDGYPSCVDEVAKKYFGIEKYNSEEFQDEAYLFVPYNEAYIEALSQYIDKAWEAFILEDVEEVEEEYFDSTDYDPDETNY